MRSLKLAPSSCICEVVEIRAYIRLPTASSWVKPKSPSAAGFQESTSLSEFMVTIAMGLLTTSASEYSFCRRSSACERTRSVFFSSICANVLLRRP